MSIRAMVQFLACAATLAALAPPISQAQERSADTSRDPALSGSFVPIAQRRASSVAAPLAPDHAAPVETASFGATLTWIDGTRCAEWHAVPLQESPLDVGDPILSDLALGPLDGPASEGDRRLNLSVEIRCGERTIARLLIVDRLVAVTASANGAIYTILQKTLAADETKRFQAQLKDMKFYLGDATGILDEETAAAAAAYAEYRGAAYRFAPVAVTENLLDGLGVLGPTR